jgi:exopolyphosphatase/guanosine-5'-triphosphate,3'-diphosphate pyrophosphatase
MVVACYAAIDIGSNSIRMEAAEVTPEGSLIEVASDRQVTRLGESVFRTGRISPAAIDFACDVLASMAQKYRTVNAIAVRAVGTSALRDASNKDEFLRRASDVLGTNVEVISGLEEARLIFMGVQIRWPFPKGRLLAVDVGGGSAEVIVGENGHLAEAYSKKIGAVRMKEVFLKSEPPTKLELAQMNEYIEQRLESVIRRLSPKTYDRAVATSGTAAAMICAVNGLSRSKRDKADRLRATTSQVRSFYDKIAGRDLEGRRKMTCIGPRRAEIIVPGTAVLLHIMRALNLPALHYSAAGLRDGIIADLAHRGVGKKPARLDSDRREIVTGMAKRYGVELNHVRKVAQVATSLFDSTLPLHHLAAQYGGLLEAAAYLYDIGHFVSDTRHHRHSSYLVANSDLPGFTQRERNILANLCRYHRKGMPAPSHADFQALDPEDRRAVLLLTPLLRLSAALDQTHEQRVTDIDCNLQNGSVAITLLSDSDVKLEKWAAEQVGDVFHQVYERQLIVEKGKT